MKVLSFKYYQDSGHGWIAVKLDLLKKVHGENLATKVSSYSYQKGNTVYLEEDMDAPDFLDALDKMKIEYILEPKYTSKLSPIRNYNSFKL
ncbi:MAG: hypothetical protein OEY94_08715 [Alphaproteobacteria bacterium]|nr:hypothetical protein [Alphaproteobacteria bacterium]